MRRVEIGEVSFFLLEIFIRVVRGEKGKTKDEELSGKHSDIVILEGK